MLIAFFGIMCAQGAVWYLSFFYVQVFLTKSLGVPEPTKDALVLAMTVASAPLYVFFGWLSDRVGRKPVMLGGMLLALVAYYPGFHGIAVGRQSGAGRGAGKQARSKSMPTPRTAPSSSTPSAPAASTASCDIAKSLLASTGISYTNRSYAGDTAIIAVGVQQIEVPDGRGLDAAGLKALKDETGKRDQGGAGGGRLSGEADPAADEPRRSSSSG